MDMTAFHQTKHLARHTAHHQGLTIELALQRIERLHDVANRAVAVFGGMRRLRMLRFLPDARIGLTHHPFAEIDAHEIFLEDIVIEHIFRSFPKIDDPFTEVRRPYAVGHVLVVNRAGRMVVAADPANAAGYEMSVARILVFYEHAVAAKNG